MTKQPKLPPGVLEEGVFRIDNSGFSKILECWREAWHLLALRRERDWRDSNMAFGSALHEALDVRQRCGLGPYTEADVAAMERAIEKHFEGVVLGEDDYLTEGRCKEALGVYLETYPEEHFDILASELAGEREMGKVSFKLPLSDGRFEDRTCALVWTGKTDGIWRDQRSGSIAIKDTKTTGQWSLDRKLNELRMSGQLKGYCWLFSDREWGEILEAVVDMVVVRKPVVRVTAKTPPRNECHRMPISFTPGLIAEWQRDVLKVVSVWLQQCASKDPPAMTGAPRACVWPKPCQFLSVCENESETDRMAWLMSGEYRDYTWNPLEKEETK